MDNKKDLAIKLRLQGFSIKEISEKLFIAKSTASLWVRAVVLSDKLKNNLINKVVKGRMKALQTIRLKTLKKEHDSVEKGEKTINGIKRSIYYEKVLCSLIYYCEGNKYSKGGVMFTNSDPYLVKTFLWLFRSSFNLDESKFRICVHLHYYHKKDEQLKFWSKHTKIPLSQFIKPYLKNNSGLYKRENYQGCVSIRYHDVSVARELNSTALVYMTKGLSVNW